MSPETYQFVLSMSGAIISLLLLILGFFIRLQIIATKSLTNSVNSLVTSVEVLKTQQDNNDRGCITKHAVVDRRLDSHSEKINDHEKRLTRLEA